MPLLLYSSSLLSCFSEIQNLSFPTCTSTSTSETLPTLPYNSPTRISVPVPDAKQRHPTNSETRPLKDKKLQPPSSLFTNFTPSLSTILYYVHQLISLHSFHRLLASLTKSLLSIYMRSPTVHLDFSHPTN